MIMLLPLAVMTGVAAGAKDTRIRRKMDWRKKMEGKMDRDMFLAYCCRCGYRISKSAPGTKSQLVCPRCGSELEVRVDGKAVMVTVLNMKEPRAAVTAR